MGLANKKYYLHVLSCKGGSIFRRDSKIQKHDNLDNNRLTGRSTCFKVSKMSERTFPVAVVAKDFLRVLEGVERKGEPAVIVRDGKRVATLSPFPALALTCAELADRWPNLERLAPDEASAFADDIEQARASLPPLRPAWD